MNAALRRAAREFGRARSQGIAAQLEGLAGPAAALVDG
jgi:hypothetical protein